MTPIPLVASKLLRNSIRFMYLFGSNHRVCQGASAEKAGKETNVLDSTTFLITCSSRVERCIDVSLLV